jgi:hypothetical protein
MHRPVVFVVAFALLSVAHGASISTTAPPYQGAITNFDDPGLWVGGVVPGPQSDVIIDTEWTVNILVRLPLSIFHHPSWEFRAFDLVLYFSSPTEPERKVRSPNVPFHP